jgi:CNT family concentrative nucleoside transporter
MIAIAWLCSSDRRRVRWRVVGWGLLLQFALGVLLLKTPVGAVFFDAMNAIVGAFVGYTETGVRFVFGALVDTGFSFVVNVLPIMRSRSCSRAPWAPRGPRASPPWRTSSWA